MQVQEPEPEPELEPEPEKEEVKAAGIELKLEDLEEVVKIYDAFRAMRMRTEPGKDRQLDKDFEERMAQTANTLKESLINDPEMKNAHILKARHSVLDITFEKLVGTVEDKQGAEIWKNVRTEQNKILEGLMGIIGELKPAVQGDVVAMQTEVAQAQKETHDVLEAAKHLESEVQRHERDKEELKKQFIAERKELQGQIASLEEENKKYLDTIIKRSKVLGVPTPNIGTKESPTRAGGDSGSKERKIVNNITLIS